MKPTSPNTHPLQTTSIAPMADRDIEQFAGSIGGHIGQSLRDLLSKYTETERSRSCLYPETLSEFERHLEIFRQTANILLLSQGRQFVLDDKNYPVVSVLIEWLNGWTELFEAHTEQYFGKRMDIHQSLVLLGNKGAGKTLLMQTASEFARVMKLGNNRCFANTSSSELLNYYKVNGSLDYYTYNIGKRPYIEGNPYTTHPFSVCLHDLGQESSKEQKHFGTKIDDVMDDFLMARYELYQNQGLYYHCTTNLKPEQFSEILSPRVLDRFRQHNFILLGGNSRR